MACALAALVSQNGLDNPFVFDDRETVLLNPSLISAWDWRAALFHNLARPVVNLSFAFDRGLSGFSSFGYHTTNLVLHITAVGLFYGCCTRALSDTRRTLTRPEAEDDSTAEWGAFFAAAVFALHPLMSAAVGYVSGRSELLAAIGVFAGITYARRAIVASNRTAAILATICGVLAIASSSSAAAFPILVLVYDAWVLKDPGWTRRAARIYAPATLAVVIAAAWYVSGVRVSPVPPRGPFANLLTESLVVWRYVGMLIVPHGQGIVHQVRWIANAWSPLGLAAFAALTGCTAAAIAWRHSQPLAAFGVVWFLCVLAPTTTFIPVRDAMAEHRVYLASTGLLLAVASVVARPLANRGVLRAIGAGVLLVLALATYRRNIVWSDPMRLWEESVALSPNAWQAHWGYAELLREIGRCDRAAPEYQAVLALNPTNNQAAERLRTCQ